VNGLEFGVEERDYEPEKARRKGSSRFEVNGLEFGVEE